MRAITTKHDYQWSVKGLHVFFGIQFLKDADILEPNFWQFLYVVITNDEKQKTENNKQYHNTKTQMLIS